MAEERIIEIKVVDGDVVKATSDVNALGTSITKVESSSKKAGASTKDAFSGAEGAANNLKGGVSGVATQFGVVTKAAKAGGAAMKSALISTGIGILLIALGEIAENWDAITNFISGANEEIEKQKRLNEDLIRQTQRLKDLKKQELELIDSQTKFDVLRAKAAGATQDEITEITRNGLQARFTITQQALEDARKLVRDSATADAEVYQNALALQTKATEDNIRARNAILEFGLVSEITTNKENKPEKRKKEKDSTLDTYTPEERQKIIEDRQSLFSELFDLEKMQQEALDGLGKEGLNAALNDENVLLAEKKKNADDYLTYKRILNAQELQLTKQTLNNISNVLGQTSAAGKAVAIASALINTYQGISAELATKTVTPFEFGLKVANIASVVGIGFKAVKDIVSTKLPSFANSAGSRGGGGSAGASPPSFNVVGNSGVSQIAQTLNQDQEPIEAYVVASSVSSAQEVNRNIITNATLG